MDSGGKVAEEASVRVRPERPGDEQAIAAVHLDAFETSLEAEIVTRLREDPKAFVPELSLVAELNGTLVGHVILSNGIFEAARVAMLGPIGVLGSHQRKGVGSALMRESIRAAKDLNYAAIVLIGHPSYYPRFGFVPASRLGLRVAFDVPDDVAMVLPLDAAALSGVAGLVAYPKAFEL